MDAVETNASFFPPPPPRHRLFTDRNLALAKSLPPPSPSSTFSPSQQHQDLIAAGATEEEAAALDEVDVRATLLEPPRLDWVEEKGGWTAFGEEEPWPGGDPKPALEGMPKLYDESMGVSDGRPLDIMADPKSGAERREALQALLQTLLHDYLSLLSSLTTLGPPSLNPPAATTSLPTPDQTSPAPADPAGLVAHMELVAFNMHGLCNEIRPRQASETLKVMMREMAAERRRKAGEIRQCVLSSTSKLKTPL